MPTSTSYVLTVVRGYNGTRSHGSFCRRATVTAIVPGVIQQLIGNQLYVQVPQSVVLGLAEITVRRTDLKSTSPPVSVVALGGYLFTALTGSGELGVIDTRATLFPNSGSGPEAISISSSRRSVSAAALAAPFLVSPSTSRHERQHPGLCHGRR